MELQELGARLFPPEDGEQTRPSAPPPAHKKPVSLDKPLLLSIKTARRMPSNPRKTPRAGRLPYIRLPLVNGAHTFFAAHTHF